MQYRKLMPWARKLTVLSVLIALIATVYVSGAATPHEAVASSHVEYVFSDWNVPSPVASVGGDQFRLIFLSSTKRKARPPLDIADYNTFVQDQRRRRPQLAIRPYADGFTRRRLHGLHARLSTPGVNARDNTGTNWHQGRTRSIG